MISTVTADRRKAGITTVISSLILLMTVVWATTSFVLVQFTQPRTETPHEPLSDMMPWPYDIPWAGGRSNWFENVNYTDLPLDQQLPEDLLQQLENIVFYVAPQDPPQLWRTGAYDAYDGSRWTKTLESRRDLNSAELVSRSYAESLGNQIYTVIVNVTAGPVVGDIELPVLFPQTLIVEDSFRTGSIVGGSFQYDSESRLINYGLKSDEYGTVLFSPLLQAPTGSSVLVSYEVTYVNQDLSSVAASALPGSNAPSEIRDMYGLPALSGVSLTPAVIGNITQFQGSGSNAYETAMIVSNHFQTAYDLILSDPEVFERPSSGQEVTDWFLARNGGLPMDFATAYCVFMRYLGIPARLAMGYAIGDPEGEYRTVRVRHMMFWAEVYIPMSGSEAGTWIQVLPMALPDDMGGSEIPENTDPGSVQLWVWHSEVGTGWIRVGDQFEVYASIIFNGMPVATGDTLIFRDVTDNRLMGSAEINPTTRVATLYYSFPSSASAGLHNLSCVYHAASFDVYNFTLIYAVASPDPLAMPAETISFAPSEVVDMNLKLGLDDYIAYWDDIIHVHGLMTVGGNPVDGSTLVNNQMQIMWDESWIGNATILSDGTYEFDISVNPVSSRMTLGYHLVWSSYAGEYQGSIPVLLPARSADNSTVEVWGKARVQLWVAPTEASRGSTLHYQGRLRLLNGTYLASQPIGLFFDETKFDTVLTNSTGGFVTDYVVPTSTTIGFHTAIANWTPFFIQRVIGNWSNSVDVEIVMQSAQLSINSTPSSPEVVHFLEDIVIEGRLTDELNGSGISAKTVHIWWNEGGNLTYLGNTTTNAYGDYQFVYTVPIGYIGSVSYWSEWISDVPNYDGATSPVLSIFVTNYMTNLTIFSDSSYYHLNETAHIWGFLTFENGTPISSRNVSVYWLNSTTLLSFNTTTNGLGRYDLFYPLSLSDGPDTVQVAAHFVSWTPLYNDSSALLAPPLTLQLYQMDLTASLDNTLYHLDEVIHVSGTLSFVQNGAPIAGATVWVHYQDSALNLQVFQRTTNGLGQYSLYYNCTTADPLGTVRIWVTYSATNPLWDNGQSDNQTATLILYALTLTTSTNSTSYHLNETVLVYGVLTFTHNSTPIQGAVVTVYWRWDNGTVHSYLTNPTNATGHFTFYYNLSVSSDRAGTVTIWAAYNSTAPLWADADSYPGVTVSLVLYAVELSVVSPGSVYLDESLVIEGTLTYQGGQPPIVAELVRLFLLEGPDWVLIHQMPTNATGGFRYVYTFTPTTQGPGMYQFKWNYSSSDPLRSSAETPFSVNALRHDVNMEFSVYPLTTYLNQSLLLYVRLYFDNGSALSDANFSVFWSNHTHDLVILVGTTNSTGEWEYLYTGFRLHTDLSPSLYVEFDGSPILENNRSDDIGVSLERWQTLITGLDTGGVTSIYVTQTLYISGVLWYDLPITDIPYGDAQVVILLDGSPIGITSSLGDGSFEYAWLVPQNLSTLGVHQISAAYVSSFNWIASYTSSSIGVNITAYVLTWVVNSPSIVYRGEDLVVTGTLSLDNGTSLVGYTVWLVLAGEYVTGNVTGGGGAFLLSYIVPWNRVVGPASLFVEFDDPGGVPFWNMASDEQSVTLRDLINIDLDPQSVYVVNHGSSLTVSGRVTNGGGNVAGVPLVVFVDVAPGSTTFYSQSDGTFSIDLYVEYGLPVGTYTLSVTVDSPYYDILGENETWSVRLHLTTVITISITIPQDVMPGEEIVVLVSLVDEYGAPVNGAVEFSVGSVVINTSSIFAAVPTAVRLTIPVSWSGGSGHFAVAVTYNGSDYIDGDSAQTVSTFHIFADAVFTVTSPAAVQLTTQPLVVNGILKDDLGNPIVGRRVYVRVGETDVYSALTDLSGRFSCVIDASPAAGTYTYTLSIAGANEHQAGPFTVMIQTNTGGNMQLQELLIPLIAVAAAAVSVLLYLYYVRGLGRRATRTTGVDIRDKLRNIRKLADSGKYSAAITLAYRTFEQMCGMKMGSERLSSETSREYVERVLKAIPLDGAAVEEFMQSYEEARFSRHEIPREQCERAIKTFTDLYPRVDTGVMTK
ncbi:MAG: DUF4129 domain-containing protein [Candidatus Thorarchaeota archaeon]|nr:DUF4129 domain-containing protein [Candidatus Thorarchaeota archaeon]